MTTYVAVRAGPTRFAGPGRSGGADPFRTQEFFEARQYVYDELNDEFDPPVAYRQLPDEVRAKVRTVAGRYDDFGKLVAHGIVSEELIIGTRAAPLREHLAPACRDSSRRSQPAGLPG